MNPIIAFTTQQRDGNARQPARLRRILRAKGLPASMATAEQVHGMGIHSVSPLRHPRRFPGVDGLLTDVPDQPLGIFTADCAAIFLSAPSYGVVGLLHAGWRGTRGRILKRALKLLQRRWKCPARHVDVWLGPCIGPCCFEVGWDVAQYFPATRRRHGSRWVVDLRQELLRQARRLGVRIKTMPASPCTKHKTTYFSYRRDKNKDRHISVIMRRTSTEN